MNNILLKTNIPEFANDISEEIRLFLSDAVISDDEFSLDFNITLSVFISENGDMWQATANMSGAYTASYSFEQKRVTGDEITVKRHKKRCVKVSVFRMMRKAFPDSFVPWGSLTGIRPTKLLRELEDESGAENACKTMLTMFDVEDKKYKIAKEIADIQRPIINSVKENDIDIYIGIPYCKTRCLYCSFPSDVRTAKTDMRPYIDALKSDIKMGSELLKKYGYNVRASYMGGGTPTVLTEDELLEVLDYAYECYGDLGCEFTVEAGRPDTITRKKLEILKEHKANRVSINPQSMNESTLKLIGRSHSVPEFIEAYEMARDIGFDINMDIITCLPGEKLPELANTLRYIEDMKPENLTVHTLALKRSSKLKQVIGDEEIASIMPDAVTADKMVELGVQTARKLSMNAYYMYRQKYMRGNLENIGYALPGKECIYNVDMMEETVSIMAHGAGSMSKRIYTGGTLRVERIPNPKDIATYSGKLAKVYEDKESLFRR